MLKKKNPEAIALGIFSVSALGLVCWFSGCQYRHNPYLGWSQLSFQGVSVF